MIVACMISSSGILSLRKLCHGVLIAILKSESTSTSYQGINFVPEAFRTMPQCETRLQAFPDLLPSIIVFSCSFKEKSSNTTWPLGHILPLASCRTITAEISTCRRPFSSLTTAAFQQQLALDASRAARNHEVHNSALLDLGKKMSRAVLQLSANPNVKAALDQQDPLVCKQIFAWQKLKAEFQFT